VLAPGGKEVVPFNTRDSGLLANRTMTIWPYTRMNDPRVWWGSRYMTLKQDTTPGQSPFKVGMDNEQGWAAYFKDQCLFIKYFIHDMDAHYPDGGMSFETYTNERFLEMESLSPLDVVEAGDTVEHVEVWELMPGYDTPENDDDVLDELLQPILLNTGCGEDCDGDCEGCGHGEGCGHIHGDEGL
jgi:hypothetical protein